MTYNALDSPMSIKDRRRCRRYCKHVARQNKAAEEWRAEMRGRAEFTRAEQNRQIKIEEAKANLEAEKLNAQAEVERAKGAAAAMKEEGGALTPMYVQYLWVRQLQLSGSETIYIPTEAGIPMLEGTRNFDYDEMARRIPTAANPK